MTTPTKKAPAAQPQPLPVRISIAETSPLLFFAALKEAFAAGYEYDPDGFVVLSPTYQMVEMTSRA